MIKISIYILDVKNQRKLYSILKKIHEIVLEMYSNINRESV